MTGPCYSYQERKGIRPISWERFHAICKGLARAVSPYNPDVILGIARGGLYAATLVSHLLRKEMYPIYLTRRVNDVKRFEQPLWRVRPPDSVRGSKVLVVDEISGSGETLSIAREEALRLGASEVRCAVLYSHEKGKAIPEYIGLITDELLLNPWDRECFEDGAFIFHSEYVAALEMQGVPPEPALLREYMRQSWTRSLIRRAPVA